MAVEIPREFFTLQSMLTLTGAAGATFVISNGLQRAFNFNPRWLGLAIAEVLCLFGVYATGGSSSDFFVGVVNGFLVYSTAAGGTAIAGARGAATNGGGAEERDRGPGERDRGPAARRERRTFLTPWF